MKPPNANLVGTGTDIRTKLGTFTQTVETAFAKGEFGKSLAAARCALFDDLFRSLLPKQEGDSCVVAIGGYGRRMLALGSDLDLRWIFDRESDRARLQSQAETVLYPLWDLKVTVGHHLLSLDEALEQGRQDISTATSLLDVRLLAGDPAMVRAMDDRVWGGLFSERYLSDFVERLEAELEGRHRRFGDSVFLLEPDVKNGTGGHRDLDAARWVARARYAVPHEDMWSQLVRVGALLEREAREISQAEEFLWKVRNSLHRAAGRRSDRLTFDGQELLSRELGYIEGEGISARSAAVERLMQDYYRHARSVRRVREKLFERAKPTKRTSSQQTDVGDGFYRFDAFIACRSTTALQETPSLALHALEKCVDHEARLWPSLREQIQQLAGDPVWCASLRNDPETPARFVALVSTSRETKFPRGSVISELLEIGLVLAVIPEFEPVTGRVHHDTYHVFTVDVHSTNAVDCLRALRAGELVETHPVATQLATELGLSKRLFLATLLHDVGKGYPDSTGSRKNHSVSGAEITRPVLERLRFPEADIEAACDLVRLHLSMYEVATRRDLDDPLTLSGFLKDIPSEGALCELYLLTIADVSTTSPTAMTVWKAKMLEALFVRAREVLVQGEQGKVESLRHARIDALVSRSGDPATRGYFEGMPDRYFQGRSDPMLLEHARLARTRTDRFVVGTFASTQPDAFELVFVGIDEPGLLSKVSAAITAGGMEVLNAELYLCQREEVPGKATTEAIDVFVIRKRYEEKELDRTLRKLRSDLSSLLVEGASLEGFVQSRIQLAARGRKTPDVLTEVFMHDVASPKHNVIEVFTKDRPGLLYLLSREMHDLGLSIALSKINTEGTRAADVFYVTDFSGSKVVDPSRIRAIQERLRERMESLSELG